MRIDKFLKNSRLIKRRAVAKEACEGGRVLINGKIAKAGSEVKVDDVIQITFGIRQMSVKVLELIESPRKETASDMYQVLD